MVRYSHTGEGFPRRDNKWGEEWENWEVWRGPHQCREYDMMKAGVKPAAHIVSHRFDDKWMKLAAERGYHVRTISLGDSLRPDFLVALPKEGWRLPRLYEEFMRTPRRHDRIGILLGYDKDHIRKFIQGLKARHDYSNQSN